jgi:hypothetical protein
MLKSAEPPQAMPATAAMQFAPEASHATQTIKKVKPGKAQSVEIAPSAPVTQPVQVAILGAANLKAALPAETAAPIEPPRPADSRNLRAMAGSAWCPPIIGRAATPQAASRSIRAA